MSEPSRAELRGWNRALTPAPLPAGDERYVPLHDAGRGAVDEIGAAIELAYEPTTQLLSGPSGSGKTTELLRLQDELHRRGFRVILMEATGYVNPSAPISITEFLVALGLAAHHELGSAAPDEPGFGARLQGLLKRLNIKIGVGPLAAHISADEVGAGAFGTSIDVALRQELTSSKPFVDELRAKLSFYIGQLYSDVATFVDGLIRDTEPDHGSAGVVFLVDGLDKLRGTAEDDFDVQQSVQRLFVNHAGPLKFGSHHTVYTVPTYLQFTAPGALPYDSRTHIVPVPHLSTRTGDTDADTEQTVSELRDVVNRRLPTERVFGDQELLMRVLHASGGNLRDLFFILRQLVSLILRISAPLPVAPAHVEEAIGDVAHDFANLTSEQASFLRRVASSDGTTRPNDTEVGLMTLLLQQHMLLAHLNGTGNWYEVHPLTRRVLDHG